MKVILSAILIALLSVNYTVCQTTTYEWNSVVTGGGGGFVTGIIFNTKEQNLVYARTDIGGAYRRDNGSPDKWMPLLDMYGADDWNMYSVDSLATDPVNPNNVYIAVGAYTNNWTSSNGKILRSNNRGNAWIATELPFKVGGNMPGRSMGERLAIDPNLNSILFFGARNGFLWKSTDSGVTFTNVTSFNYPVKYVEKSGDSYLGDTDGVVWVVFDNRTGSSGRATQRIFVGVADKGFSIYKSINGGDSWTAIGGEPKGFLPHHGVLSSEGILYVTYSNGAGPYDGTKGLVYKYDTSSTVWTDISPVAVTSEDATFGYGGLSVDAKNPKTVMVAALNSWSPDTIIWRSTDAGATWKRIWEWANYPSRTLHYHMDASAAPWLDFGVTAPTGPEPAVKLGWMIGSLAIDPFDSNKMLYGTGATLFGSDDLTNWDKNTNINIEVKAAGIEETSVLKVITLQNLGKSYLLSAMRNVSGFRHDLSSPAPALAPAKMWSVPFAGTYTDIDYAEDRTNLLVLVGYGKPTDNPPIVSCAYSTNGGVDWTAASNDPSGMTEGGGTVAVTFDNGNNEQHTVWSPASGGVFYTDKTFKSWTKSTGIDGKAKVASDRADPKKFYGFANNTFFKSVDGGVSFTATKFKSFGNRDQFKAVPKRDGEIWFAAGTSGLFHSTDSGDNFARLPGVTVANVVGFGQKNAGKTYPSIFIHGVVGTNTGIFRSDDEGATWGVNAINDASHQYGSVQCITGDMNDNKKVYFGTNGRGIIYGELK